MDQDQFISSGISTIIFVSMIIVGLDVTLRDFKSLSLQPKTVLTGLLTLTLFVPISMAFVSLLDFPATLEAGILLLAICPAGSIANLYTSVGRGNLALSITLSVITGLSAFLTMPFWLKIYERLPGDVFEFQVPASLLLVRLFFVLALPIALGTWLRARFPGFERKCHRFLKRIALAGVVSLGGYIIFSDRKGFAEGFGLTALSAVSLTLIGMAVAYAVARLFRLERRDAVTLLLISLVKNFGVAIAIAVSILHQAEFAVFATTMFMAQLPTLLGAGLILRRFGAERPGPIV